MKTVRTLRGWFRQVRRRERLAVCGDCGVAVGDRTAHVLWHAGEQPRLNPSDTWERVDVDEPWDPARKPSLDPAADSAGATVGGAPAAAERL